MLRRSLLALLSVASSPLDVVSADEAAHDDYQQLFKELRGLLAAGNDTQWPKGESKHIDKRDLVYLEASAAAPSGVRERFELRRVHVGVLEWLAMHQASRKDLMRRLMRRAVRDLKIFTSEWQWAEAFHEGLAEKGRPLFSQAEVRERWPAMADALLTLQDQVVSSFVADYEATDRPFVEHNEGLHVQGLWEVLYIFDDRCKKKLFRRSCEALDAFDKALRAANQGYVQQARFARLNPGGKVVPHTATGNQRLKVHCGIENPDGVAMRIANLTHEWKRGECVLLDDSFEHDIESRADQRPRIILEMKVRHPDLSSSGYEVDEESGRIRHFSRKQRGKGRTASTEL
eukprot:TRINITY_DN50853_c0_g1_i1.p1 TRINITY_DN50853_c0_g1~~TRINITY_DN50853_c0_g1_i1.p1  ORF type:complete len:345 (-),score=51.36 TRINITY_DN50853_c0_g1_i1:12-1046(-)